MMTLTTRGVQPVTKLPKEALETLRTACSAVTVERPIIAELTELRRMLNSKGVVASDRRYRQSLDVLKAAAFLSGRAVVDHEDLVWVEHILWTEPQERTTVLQALSELNAGLDEEVRKLVRQAEKLATMRAGAGPAERKRTGRCWKRIQNSAKFNEDSTHYKRRLENAGVTHLNSNTTSKRLATSSATFWPRRHMAELNTVARDGFDHEAFHQAIARHGPLREQMEALDRLLPHGARLAEDLFCIVFKLNAELIDEQALLPSLLINRAIVLDVMESTAVDDLERRTALDVAESANAASRLAAHVECLKAEI